MDNWRKKALQYIAHNAIKLAEIIAMIKLASENRRDLSFFFVTIQPRSLNSYEFSSPPEFFQEEMDSLQRLFE